jgi:hypothetical protein
MHCRSRDCTRHLCHCDCEDCESSRLELAILYGPVDCPECEVGNLDLGSRRELLKEQRRAPVSSAVRQKARQHGSDSDGL